MGGVIIWNVKSEGGCQTLCIVFVSLEPVEAMWSADSSG